MEASSSGCTCLGFLYSKTIQNDKMIPKGSAYKMKWQRSAVRCHKTFCHGHWQALFSPLSWSLHTPSGVQPASGILDTSCHNTCGKQMNMFNDLRHTVMQLPLTFRMRLYLLGFCRHPPVFSQCLQLPEQWTLLSLVSLTYIECCYLDFTSQNICSERHT